MEQNETLTSEQSLELIVKMISRAKNEYYNTGVSALLWGSVIIFCCLVTYLNEYLRWPALEYIWWLTIVAIVPQIYISIRESRSKDHRTHQDSLIGGIWLSYGIAICLFAFIDSQTLIRYDCAIYLTLFGIPTFATGFGSRFRPMIVGGLACWAFAVLSLYLPTTGALFLLAGGALVAWFIPGLILRKCYLEAKRKHV